MPNNVTPLHAPQQQDWWSPPTTWPPQPGCGPPQPCPQPCPQPPSCFSPIAKADACWDQSQALYNLVSKVVMDIFQTNPGIIPSPPPSQGSGPILGVTDGSAAQPGFVGEFVQTVTPVSFPATTTTTNISGGILQPGDWDVWAAFYPGAFCAGLTFFQTPQAVGTAIEIMGLITDLASFTTGGSGASNAVVVSPVTRASLAVPTLFPFSIGTNVLGPGQAGNGEFILSARRVR